MTTINSIKMAEAANLAFSNHIKWNAREWTVFAAVLDDQYVVIAMGSGLKCIPECKLVSLNQQLPLYYDTIRDIHAEVVCRRAFIRYLLLNPQERTKNYHLYLTLAPCGDASMPPLDTLLDCVRFESACKVVVGRGRENWSQRGIVRTKPGRGDAPSTKSVSCSDKIALWNVVGMQGSFFPEKVFFATIIIDDPRANIKQLTTSLKERVGLKEADKPSIVLCDSGLFKHGDSGLFKHGDSGLFKHTNSRLFKHNNSSQKTGSFSSHAWHLGMPKPEVIVDGRRLGAIGPEKGQLPLKSISCIASSSLYKLAGISKKNASYLNEKEACIDKYLNGWPRANDIYSNGNHTSSHQPNNDPNEQPNEDGKNAQFQ